LAAVENAGFVEVNVGLDEARHDQPAGDIDLLALGGQDGGNGRDPAFRDSDIDQ
jgi:hypothetical protein